MKLMFSLVFTLCFLFQGKSFSQEMKRLDYTSYTENLHGVIETRYYTLYQPPDLPADYTQSLPHSINVSIPFSRARHISKINNEVIFDQVYEMAELGLRKTPESYLKKDSQLHLVVAGDSNTFGEGTSIDVTLPMLLSKKIPHTTPYNFGIRGGGPHNTLAMMELLNWNSIIKEKKGVFIYNHYDFLLERVIGEKNYIAWSKGIAPYYDLNDKGVAVFKGPFNHQPLQKLFLWMSSKQWLNDIFPVLPKPRHEHTVLLGKVYLKMYETYKNTFPKGHFFVLINSYFQETRPGRLQELEVELVKNKVPFIKTPPIDINPEHQLKDFHLNSEGHKLEAELVLKVLPLNEVTR